MDKQFVVGTPQYTNHQSECVGCIYCVPRKLGGRGLICNGVTMEKFKRCPEWVINEYLQEHKKLDMKELVDGLKL